VKITKLDLARISAKRAQESENHAFRLLVTGVVSCRDYAVNLSPAVVARPPENWEVKAFGTGQACQPGSAPFRTVVRLVIPSATKRVTVVGDNSMTVDLASARSVGPMSPRPPRPSPPGGP
jgi:hypothetical protein